jgi:hypothetical protein
MKPPPYRLLPPATAADKLRLGSQAIRWPYNLVSTTNASAGRICSQNLMKLAFTGSCYLETGVVVDALA